MVVGIYFRKDVNFISQFFILFLFLFSSCDKIKELGENDEGKKEVIFEIPEAQTSWDISSVAKVLKIDFVSKGDWKVEVEASASSWLSVSPSEGTAGEYTLEISVSANETEESRSGKVSIVSGSERRDIHVVQGSMGAILEIPEAQTSWDISSVAKVLKIDFVSKGDWKVEVEASASSWLSVFPSEGTAGEYTLEISVSANETEESRSGKVSIVSGSERRDIHVVQKEKVFKPESGGPEDMPIEEWK